MVAGMRAETQLERVGMALRAVRLLKMFDGRLGDASLRCKNQFRAGNDKHSREQDRDGANGKTPAAEIRTNASSDYRGRSEKHRERRNRLLRANKSHQARNRIYQNEERRYGRCLFRSRPVTKEQKRREKYSAAGAGKAGQKSNRAANANRHWKGRGMNVRRIAAAKKQTCRREKQHDSNQYFQSGGWELQITAKVCRWN